VDLDLDQDEERVPLRILDRRGLVESVRREVERLCNTRIPRGAHRRDGEAPTILDYGVPDFSDCQTLSPDEQQRILADVARALEAFEPRLRHVELTLDGASAPYKLALALQGEIVSGDITEPLSFPVLLGDAGLVSTDG
jgi:type VI secretion system lysozyme-like protein